MIYAICFVLFISFSYFVLFILTMLLLSIPSCNILKQYQYARQYTNNTKHLISQSYIFHNIFLYLSISKIFTLFFLNKRHNNNTLLFPFVIFAIYYLLTDISLLFSTLLKKRFYVLRFATFFLVFLFTIVFYHA